MRKTQGESIAHLEQTPGDFIHQERGDRPFWKKRCEMMAENVYYVRTAKQIKMHLTNHDADGTNRAINRKALIE